MTHHIIQNSESLHFSTLELALAGCVEEPHDICFIGRDGDEVFSHQALLNLHSPLLDEILVGVKDVCPKVSVDASSNTINTLLQLLFNGEVATDDNKDLVYSVAESLGINMDNLVLESSDKVVSISSDRNRKATVGNNITTTLEEDNEDYNNITTTLEEDNEDYNNITTTLEETNEAYNNITTTIEEDNEDYNNDKKTVEFDNCNITLTRTSVPNVKLENMDVDNKDGPSDLNERPDMEEETDRMFKEFNLKYLQEEDLGDDVPCPEVECSVCTRTFKTKWYLKQHMKNRCKGKVDESFNFKIEGLKCYECGKEFTLNQTLKRHKLRNLCKRSFSPLIKIKGKKCDDCGKEFTLNQSLQRHVIRNLCKGKKDNYLKTFKCDKCEKTFGRKQSLQMHQVIHTGDLPYICKECGDCFAWTDQLKKHVKFQHDTKLSEEIKCSDYVNNEDQGNETLSDEELAVYTEEDIIEDNNDYDINEEAA